jgi:aubergine-like protein
MINKRVKSKMIAESGGRLMNPQPGTVLDHSVTQNEVYDFYLVTTNCR